MIALDQAVANARLGDDGNARLTQSGEVAIDGANADLEMRGHVFGPHHSPALQSHHHRHQAVHSVHRLVVVRYWR